MRAVTIEDFGTVPAVNEVTQPVPGPGEILVQVHAASLNGFDVGVVYGALKDILEHKFPITLGKDYAGTVAAVGEGVDRAVGDRVFGVVMKPVVCDGALAEYVVVGQGYGIAAIPQGLDFERAGALALAGTAATNILDALAPADDDTLLIAGATGGVGAYLIQLAAARGATVIATAKPGEESTFVLDLGATHVVDYTQDLAAQVRAITPTGVTSAVHLAGDPTQLASLVAPGGKLASTLGFAQEHAGDREITVATVMANPEPAILERLATAVTDGTLQVPVRATYALDAASHAFAAFTGGSLGKIVVTVA